MEDMCVTETLRALGVSANVSRNRRGGERVNPLLS